MLDEVRVKQNIMRPKLTQSQLTQAKLDLSNCIKELNEVDSLRVVSGLLLKNHYNELIHSSKNSNLPDKLKDRLALTVSTLKKIIHISNGRVIADEWGRDANDILKISVSNFTFADWAENEKEISAYVEKSSQNVVQGAADTIKRIINKIELLTFNIKAEMLDKIRQYKTSINSLALVSTDSLSTNKGLTEIEVQGLKATVNQLTELKSLHVSTSDYRIKKMLKTEIWTGMPCSILLMLSFEKINNDLRTKSTKPWYKFYAKSNNQSAKTVSVIKQLERIANLVIRDCEKVLLEEKNKIESRQ